MNEPLVFMFLRGAGGATDMEPGFPLRYHYDSGLTPNAENKDACFTVTSLYIGAFPG